MVTGAKSFKCHDFESGYSAFHAGLEQLTEICQYNQKKSQNDPRGVESLLSQFDNTERFPIPTTHDKLVEVNKKIQITAELLKKQSSLTLGEPTKHVWHARILANLINGMALTIRYHSEKSQVDGDVFELYQTLIKFYSLANTLFLNNPILQANYAIFLDRADAKQESNEWAKKAYQSGLQDIVIRSCYALSLMRRAYLEPKDKFNLLNSSLLIFDNILKEYPNTPAVLNNRGFLYFLLACESYKKNEKKELLQKSLSDLNHAETLAPMDDLILFNRAATKFQLGDFKDAHLDLDTIQRLYPHMAQEPHVLYLSSAIYQQTGEQERAKNTLLKAKVLVIARQNKFGLKTPIRIDEYVEPADKFMDRIEEKEGELITADYSYARQLLTWMRVTPPGQPSTATYQFTAKPVRP